MTDALSSSAAEPPRFVVADPSGTGRRIACRNVTGTEPTIVWLGGYRSDMRGTKAERLDAFARANGHACLRFDYSGHGESDGRFEDGTISRWQEDAEAAIAALADKGRLLLVGSSMGAWIALLLAPKLRGRLAGMLLLAPAPDFTERLVMPKLSEEQRREMEVSGFLAEPSEYSEQPNIYTRGLIEDGQRNLVMRGTIEAGCPIHVIQGMADPDVPYTHAIDLVSHLPADGVTLTLVPGGDHRLSRPADIARMEDAVRSLLASR